MVLLFAAQFDERTDGRYGSLFDFVRRFMDGWMGWDGLSFLA